MPPPPIPGARHCPVYMEDCGMIPEALTTPGWWAKPQGGVLLFYRESRLCGTDHGTDIGNRLLDNSETLLGSGINDPRLYLQGLETPTIVFSSASESPG